MPIRPIIFVGLGSTGGKIVSLLKAKLDKTASELDKRFYKYVNIRSEVVAEPGTDNNIFSISLASESTAARTAVEKMWLRGEGNDKAVAEFRKWWYTDENDPNKPWIPPTGTLEIGVSGNPSMGRALLHENLADAANSLCGVFYDYANTIKDAHDKLPFDQRDIRGIPQINVFLFGSLAGGTCSGTFFDLALSIRYQLTHCFETNNAYLFGVFLMGDACSKGKSNQEDNDQLTYLQHRNTQYSIAQMTFLSTKTGWNIASQEWPRTIGSVDMSKHKEIFDANPFTGITLMGAENDDGFSFSLAGNNFDAYLRFLANYYSDYITSGAFEKLIPRYIDGRGDLIDENPTRPLFFTRIGYMSLQIPKGKIEALIRKKVAEELRLEFKTPDGDNCKKHKDIFFSKLNIDDWAKRCLYKMGDVPVIPSDDPLQDTSEDFEQTWVTVLNEIDKFYASAIDEDSKFIKNLADEFKKKWEPILSELLDNVLGQKNETMALSDIKVLLSEIMETISSVFKANLDIRTEKSSLMTSLLSDFKKTLERNVDEFPTGFLSYFKRKNSLANQEMGDALKKYLIAIQDRAKATIDAAIRKPLLEELEKHNCVRELISHFATGPAYRSYIKDADKLFAEDDNNMVDIQQDIFTTKDVILNSFVTPLLSDNDQALLHSSIKTILNKWTGSRDSGSGVAGVWWNLIAQFGTNPPRSSDIEYNDNKRTKETLDKLQETLRISFNDACTEVFGTAISQLSVWDAISRFVKQEVMNGKEAEKVLKGLFGFHLNHAKCFPRWYNRHSNDNMRPVRSPFYICNKEDARKCFAELNIPNPDGFMDELITLGLGGRLSTESQSASVKDRIQLFLCVIGELPYFYRGFEDVMEILIPQGAKQKKHVWCDSRFPAWIEKWWDTDYDNQPYYLRTQGDSGNEK